MANGSKLSDGLIPAGKPCPFLDTCPGKHDWCPTEENLKKKDASCAAARAWDMLVKNPKPKDILPTK